MKQLDLTQLKEKIGQALSHHGGTHERIRIHPRREWVTGIVVTLSMVIIGGLISRYLYVAIIEQETTDSPSIPTTPYKGPVIESALSIYNMRQAGFEEIVGAKRMSITPNIEPAITPSETSTTTSTTTPITTQGSSSEPVTVEEPSTSEVGTDTAPNLSP